MYPILLRDGSPSAPTDAPAIPPGALLRVWRGPVPQSPDDRQRETPAAPPASAAQIHAARAAVGELAGRLCAELDDDRRDQEWREALWRLVSQARRQVQLAADRLRRQYRAPCDRTPPRPSGATRCA